jgi:LacI family transcriptional regulator
LKRTITLKLIAKELGFSISTVSKALQNSAEISLDTRETVQAFAKFHNYRPNNIALSLKYKRTRNIGVIIPDIVHHFFTTVFRGIENYANKKGYNVIVCVSDESFDKEARNLETLANGSIDGLIMALSAETQLKNDFGQLKQITSDGIPLVLFDRVTDEIDCDKVVGNDRGASYMAVKNFIDAGRRKIALVTTESYLNVSRQREEGYYKALKDHDLPIREDLILRLPYRYENEQLSAAFFATRDLDAVLCVNEIFAIRSMRMIQEQGHAIPDDVAVIGFTDGILSRLAYPSLTAVAQHGEKIGEVAASLLINRLEQDPDISSNTHITEVVEATLVERESTGKGSLMEQSNSK